MPSVRAEELHVFGLDGLKAFRNLHASFQIAPSVAEHAEVAKTIELPSAHLLRHVCKPIKKTNEDEAMSSCNIEWKLQAIKLLLRHNPA